MRVLSNIRTYIAFKMKPRIFSSFKKEHSEENNRTVTSPMKLTKHI